MLCQRAFFVLYALAAKAINIFLSLLKYIYYITMKKQLLSAFAVLFSLAAGAQVVITESDFANVGDQLFLGNDTVVAGSISAGGSGSAQTWNFDALVPDLIDTLNFIDPSTLPAFGDFPSANISFKQMGGDAYVEKSATGVKLLGFSGQIMGAPFPITAPVTPSQSLMEFPAQLGISFQDTSSVDVKVDISSQAGSFGIDSARFKRTFYTQHLIDAEGSVSIPLGDYNAIRDKVDETTVDTIWIHSPSGSVFPPLAPGWQIMPDVVAGFVGLSGGVSTTTTRNYRWFSANSKFFLVDMAVNPANDTPISARYQADPSTLPSGVAEEVYNSNAVQLFPNPAAEIINVVVKDLKNKAYLHLFDATGRQISSAQLTANINQISTDGLTNGLYMFRVVNGNGNLVKTGKVLIAK